ncbi:MAG: Asp-tRNA(Asn)/Glu-tRNA(Gln) amidotransferase subunit GatC [Candidatus Woesebacteria bacterium]|nr:Asp-tRNA(Asn)/Glu-tRNA(Gln) amidotransferase subunit GatC [Candidatus Woesebacteria bacterium]
MAKLSVDEVKHIAKLSKLDLTSSEINKFQKQLSKIVDYVSKLSEVDTSNLEPTSQTTSLENVFRIDEVRLTSITQENGYFIVDRILNKEE